KIEANKIEFSDTPFSLEKLLSNIRNMFMLRAYEKNLAFTIHIDESVPVTVIGDDRRLQQVIVNLVGNAFKFTHKGSVIIDCSYKDRTAIIRISDTGIGIPKNKQEVIFSAFSQADPSTTRNYGGTGLGLTISRKLIGKMGGKIIVVSNPGEGSCFTLEVPLPSIDKKANLRILPGQSAERADIFDFPEILESLSAYRILVAEDTPDNQLLFKELLTRLNVRFEIAVNGEEALALLKKHRYDLLLLDMQMPIIDGLEVISVIRGDDTLKDLYVIALTAHSLKGDEEKYLKAGCDDYMSKPINIDSFFNRIIEILRAKEKDSLNFPLREKEENLKKEYDISVLSEKTDYFKRLIDQLKRSCDLFDPAEIFHLGEQLGTCLKGNDVAQVIRIITEATRNYDDDLLLELIPFLEEL
ncbi:MAG: response regulator, partial [Spirochaetales bacterium]|nr:response regulator [Spirochaetales bacterium]